MSDFDNFIRHSDFRKVLQLADLLRYHKAKVESLRSESSQIHGVDSRESYYAYDNAAELLRSSLPTSKFGSSAMQRGECMMTDSLIDETIESLVSELRFYLDIKKQRRARAGSQVFDPVNAVQFLDTKLPWVSGVAVDEKNNPVPDKFSKVQTDIMTDWMIAHKEHPFPTQDEVYSLATVANLTPLQVVNWFTNVRKRSLKATVVKEKKPHHFLDYLFLATDREKRMLAVHPDMRLFLSNIAPNLAQPFMLCYAPSEQRHIQQQPTNTRRRSESSRKTSHIGNEQIFRRGKGQGYKKAELLAKLAEREAEKRVLEEVAPRGMDDTPAGYFTNDDFKLGFDDMDLRIFDQFTNDFNSISPNELDNGERPNTVSFESLGDITTDEGVDDYVLGLIAGV